MVRTGPEPGFPSHLIGANLTELTGRRSKRVSSFLSILKVQGNTEHFRDDCGDALTWLDMETYYTAFTEGWALYSEKPLIADDTDAYDNEPMQKFGMLKWQVQRDQQNKGKYIRAEGNISLSLLPVSFSFFLFFSPFCSAFTRLQFGGKRFCKCP